LAGTGGSGAETMTWSPRALLLKSPGPVLGRARLRRRAAGWLCAVLAAGLPAAALADRPVQSLLELRKQNVIVQKFDLSCGAAALATVLNYQFGDPVTEKQLTEGLIRRKEYIENPEVVRLRQGFSLLDLKRVADARGYQGVGYGKLDFADLTGLAPAIVPVSPLGYNHFVIFRGRIGDQVLLADPAFGNRTMSVEKFERVWIDFPELGRVAFVITRNGRQAPPGLLAVNPAQFVAPPDALVRQVLRF
jgi:predicted double-glycine peptidase